MGEGDFCPAVQGEGSLKNVFTGTSSVVSATRERTWCRVALVDFVYEK